MPAKTLIVNSRWLMVLTITVLFCSLFTFHFSLALAETSPPDKAQEDYSYQLTKYTELKDKYQLAKSSYLTFKTATSKNEAFLKTKDYLKQIDNVYKAYLLLVEERTNTVNWDYASASRDDLHKQIEEDSKFFDNNGKDIDASQTLENLPTLADSIKQHVETITLKIAFDTLSATDLAQIEEVNALFHTDYKLVDDLVSTKTQDRQLYNNWKTEVDGIQNNLDKEMEVLKTQPKKIAQYSAQKPTFSYDTSKPIDILKSTKSILREILKSI